MSPQVSTLPLEVWSIPPLRCSDAAVDLKQAIIDHKNIQIFAIGVIAVPAAAPVDLPLPLAARPVARGPHTAVVIGPDGTSTKQQDLYCDAIGRVRVRFPWDPGPPQNDSQLPPIFPFSQPNKPTTVGENTCWVRVVEGWAGRHYGIQFLPRIGQEVLVDFLDGDPERPVITGRLYNADRTTTNLPFPDSSVKDTQLNKLTDLPNTVKSDPPLSGIKTWSIPTTDGDGKPLPTQFQLMRFSDKRDSEQFLIRAQHRLDITAFDKRYESIGPTAT
jgi:type VI secretion system secreted protein VgrG